MSSKRNLRDDGERNAVIYARYSSHSQRDVSIEQQVQKCREYAQREGLTVLETYSDAAISGKTDNRPAFQRMMKDSKKHRWQYVIAWKSNRMGRNMMEAMINNAELMKEGISCLYVEEDFDDTAAGRFALRNMMNVNQFYSENMAEDIRRGLMDNAEKALVNTRPPFGYAVGPDRRYVIREDQAEIVREIFNRILEGWSFISIANDLNRRGIKTALGREWNKSSFHAMIKNEMYLGVYKYSSVRIEGGVPAIIDRGTFEEVQRKVQTKRNAPGQPRNSTGDYMLTGKLFCGHCREPMVGVSGTGKHGELHYYYACQGRRRKKNGCEKKNVVRDKIEQQVINAIRDYILTDDMIDSIVDGYTRFYESARKDSVLQAMRERLKENQKATANLMKAIEMGIITDTTKARLLELEAEKKDLETSINSQELVLRRLTPGQFRFGIERYRSMDFEKREVQRQLIRTFVQEIYLYDDHMKILFSFDPSGEHRIDFDKIECDNSSPASGSYSDASRPLYIVYTNPAIVSIFAHGFVLTVPV